MTARDLFVSHSSGDAEVARALRTVLEDAGYTCWMAPDDIVGTETWTEQILDAIADSKAMIVLVSAASNRSQHVSREVNLALGKGRPVLPIRIEDVAPGGSLEYLLSLVQRVDAFPPPVSLHRDRILRMIDTIVERPQPAADSTATQVVPLSPVAPPPPPPPLLSVTPTEVVVGDMVVQRPPPTPARRPGGMTGLLLGAGAVVVVAGLVLVSGVLNGPGSSPKPTEGAIASGAATSLPSTTSTEPPMTIGPTAGPLKTDELRLQSLLPAVAGIDRCVSWPTPPGGEDMLSPSGYGGSMARITCPGPATGDRPTEYALYLTKEAMKADFDAIMTTYGVAAGGACISAIPANAPWGFPDLPVSGDLGCFERDGRVQWVWTQNELRVLGQWLAPDNPTGRAFWQAWTTTPNAAEATLLANLPTSANDAGACVRAADLYYATALAIVSCPRPKPLSPVYYAQFENGATFPDDVMTAMFDSVMTSGGWPDDTATGCYDTVPTFGRYTWGYSTNGTIGDTEGYLGCFSRTDSEGATAQFVWTFNRTAVMGLWYAPDLQTGIDFFDDWIGEVK